MFDPVTAAFLRTAPKLPGLNPDDLPQTLTERFAKLVAWRLRRAEGEHVAEQDDDIWPLNRIADTYELVTSISEDQNTKRAAAFVAGTAQQILAQESVAQNEGDAAPILDRDRVDPALAAAILFLAAEQYADAIEAAQKIKIVGNQQDYLATLLAEDIRDLASSRLSIILSRARRRPAHFAARGGLEARSTTALFEALLVGVELFAAEVLGEQIPEKTAGRFDTARSAFSGVLHLSSRQLETDDPVIGTLLTTYPGPRHLAALLLAAYDGMANAALTKIDTPPGVDNDFWIKWLRHRANAAPFTWRNHREAVTKLFHHNGNSAVMILPTGAGKTTVSCLKIASVLGSGRSVVFIAPTHALVEQLTVDLQEIFPEELLGSLVSSDYDRLFAVGTSLRKIEVMTPEHCLALLSYAPEAFDEVGLMVFDECHLLSPISGLRRALDGMFCVLAFNSIAPEADLLFLSAMIKNGAEFAHWIGSITKRDCVFVDPLWKPSRQARGIVFYEKNTLDSIRLAAIRSQRANNRAKGKIAKALRKAASSLLKAEPFAMFGLHHNWLHEDTADCSITKLSETPVQLGGQLSRYGNEVLLKPNVNSVAAHIAVSSAHNGLKTIVFVNVKAHAVSTARKIAEKMNIDVQETVEERERWQALETELGGRVHSLINGPSPAVPHNALMIRLERDLAERMFRRKDGAQVIVATPTLAQGLNLPAHLAILASDMRADLEDGGRKPLGAHEILNAAARAGRAGHLANGVVLLIPEEILTFEDDEPLDHNTVEKLKAVLPEDDRCIEMSDPMQLILDRISTESSQDADVEYALNRLSTAVAPEDAETEAITRFPVKKSFGAFLAAKQGTIEQFDQQIERLHHLLAERNTGAEDQVILELAAQSGASISVLNALQSRLREGIDALPITIPDWVVWIFKWLTEDDSSRKALLEREHNAILGAVGRKIKEPLSEAVMRELLPGVIEWLCGQPLRVIEFALGGNPDEDSQRTCPRARRLVTSIIPMGMTFITGLVARTAKEIAEITESTVIPHSVLECLPTAVRRGFDTPFKLAFAESNAGLLSRVQTHQAYAEVVREEPEIEVTMDYGEIVVLIRERFF